MSLLPSAPTRGRRFGRLFFQYCELLERILILGLEFAHLAFEFRKRMAWHGLVGKCEVQVAEATEYSQRLHPAR